MSMLVLIGFGMLIFGSIGGCVWWMSRHPKSRPPGPSLTDLNIHDSGFHTYNPKREDSK